jgi:peptide/histidine transporter 3/4
MKFQHFREWVEFWKTPLQPEIGRNNEQLEWVSNGSVDVRGRPALRKKSGGWKASIFILVFVFSEALAYVAIALTMIIYLTTVLDEGVATAVKNVNYWVGTTCVMPLIGGFMADVYFGRYRMVLISSTVYVLGLVLLTLSVSLPALKPNNGVFFLALYLISVGIGGHKPSLEPFGVDQFDEEDKTEMLKKNSFFNHWFLWLCVGMLLAVTVVAYVQENISWGFGFGIVTVAMAISTLLFLYGTPFYRHKVPGGSPVTGIAQVVVAAIRKRNINMPSDTSLLYEKDVGLIKSGQKLLLHTDNFPFLDKAAIMVQDSSGWIPDEQESKKPNPWIVCPVTQVEETKIILRMVPIWLSCLIFAMTALQSNSLFVKQGSTMDRSMGSHFRIPSASLLAFQTVCAIVFVIIYDRCIVALARRITGNERGITVLQRIGIGMFFSVLSMVTAALTENMRIHVAKTHDLLDSPKTTIPLSVFWLTPQFVLMGIAEVFSIVGLQEYFYDQVPDSMRSLGIAFYLSVLGVSSFLGSFLVTIVEGVSKRGGHIGWLANNLNRAKLGYFYWLLAILSVINLSSYVCLARTYKYKNLQQITSDMADSSKAVQECHRV